jgi:drug/metabolite transporter (DMT)-like permease
VRRGSVADLMLFATTLLWALNFTVSKYILEHGLRPLAYSALRYSTAALVFVAITYPREKSLRIGRGDVLLVGGAVAVLLGNQLSFVYALDFTTATTVALLFGTLPIFTALISRFVGIEQLDSRFWIAASVSFAGVALVAVGSGGSLSADFVGDLLALAGAATWGAYSVAIAPLMRRYSPYRLSAVLLLAVSVPLVLLGTPQIAHEDFDWNALVWIGFVFAVLGPLVVTNLLWFSAIDRVGPSHAAVFANLQPFLAALIALLLLNEDLTRLQVVGGLAIAAGILLSRRRAPEPEPEPT